MKGSPINLQFGETVDDYAVPVLNEREIRAAAGLLFLSLFIALIQILFKQDFLLVKYVIMLFFTDFGIRIFISPQFSPVLILGRLIVSHQAPEYVGAPQKKFAWTIGLILSGFMFLLMVVFNSYSSFTLVICIMCLTFLFFESAFGICLACVVYGWLYKIQPLYCAGSICEVKQKHSIQQISRVQFLIIAGAFLFIGLAIVFLNDRFSVAPIYLKELNRDSGNSRNIGYSPS